MCLGPLQNVRLLCKYPNTTPDILVYSREIAKASIQMKVKPRWGIYVKGCFAHLPQLSVDF